MFGVGHLGSVARSAGKSLPALPAAVISAGVTTLQFLDDFTSTSTIDMANTGNAGFNWYLKTSWPNIPTTHAPWGAWASATPTSAAHVTAANSIVTLANDDSGNDIVLSTACAAANAQGYNGTVFGPGSTYYEASMAFDPTLANLGAIDSDPIVWMMPITFLTGVLLTAVEIDMPEMLATGVGNAFNYLVATHDWTVDATTIVANNANTNITASSSPASYISQNIYGCLHLVPADNGGTGLVRFYLNGVALNNDITYTPGAPASSGSPSNPNGTYADLASQQNCVFLGCGQNGWYAKFDYFRVFSKGTPPAVTTTLDPKALGTGMAINHGSNTLGAFVATGTTYVGARSRASHTTGKYYCEFAFSGSVAGGGNYNIGVQNASESMSSYLGFTGDSDSGGIFGDSGVFYVNSVAIGTGPGTWGTTPIVSMAFDAGAGLIWFSVNGGIWNNNAAANPDTGVGGFSIAGVTGPYFASLRLNAANGAAIGTTAYFGGSAYNYKTALGNVTTFGNW